MATGYPLRFYADPLKLMIQAIIMFGCLIISCLIMRYNAFPLVHVIGWICLIVSGFATIIFLLMLCRYLLLCQPWLEIDGQAWSRSNPFGRTLHINWQDIASITLHCQLISRDTYQYWILLQARSPEQLSHQRLRAFNGMFYPVMRNATDIPLNQLFLRATPEKCQRLLDRIVASCGHELQLYGIEVECEIKPL